MCRVNDHSLRIARLNIAKELNADLPLHLSAQSRAGHSLSPSDGLPLVNHRLVVAHSITRNEKALPPFTS